MGSNASKLTILDVVHKLATEDQVGSDFWEEVYFAPSNDLSNFIEKVTPTDIRSLRDKKPETFRNLFTLMLEQIITQKSTPQSEDSRNIIISTINLLNRLIPFVHEDKTNRDFVWSSTVKLDKGECPIGEALLLVVYDLLFLPALCLESDAQLETLDNHVQAFSHVTSGKILQNRNSVLVLLLTLLSEQLYELEDATSTESLIWLKKFESICQIDERGKKIFFALIFVAFSPNSGHESIILASQIVSALVEIRQTPLNLFGEFITSLETHMNLPELISSFTTLLIPQKSGISPWKSQRSAYHSYEILYIFWAICYLNKSFVPLFVYSESLVPIVNSLLEHIQQGHEMVTNTFIRGKTVISMQLLVILSADRSVAVLMNSPHSPEGTMMDHIIATLYLCVFSKFVQQSDFVDYATTILVNLSPYMKSITEVSATDLLSIMKSTATPWYLLQRKSNYICLLNIVEAINNIISHQSAGNSIMMYNIIKDKEVFFALQRIESSMEQFSKPWLNEEYWADWNSKLRCSHIMAVIDILCEPIDYFCVRRQSTDSAAIVAFIESGTLVGLLPLPQPFTVRRFIMSEFDISALKTELWISVYMNPLRLGLWFDTEILLFYVERSS